MNSDLKATTSAGAPARVHVLHEGSEAELLAPSAAATVKLSEDRLLWLDIDLDAPDADELCEAVSRRADLPRERTLQLLRPNGRAQANDHHNLLRVEVIALNEAHEFGPSAVTCLVGDGWVATAHRGTAQFIDDFQDALAGGSDTGSLDAPAFLAILLAWQVRTYQEAIDHITEHVDELDQVLLRPHPPRTKDVLDRLVELRSRLSRARRLLAPHRAAYQRLASPELDRLSTSASASAFGQLKGETDDTVEAIQGAREMLLGSFEILTAQTSQRTNDVMKILTFVSIVLLPSALLAGVLGMNFKPGLFDNANLFWVAVLGMAGLMAATVIVAWAVGWIGDRHRFDPPWARAEPEDGKQLEESADVHDDDRATRPVPARAG